MQPYNNNNIASCILVKHIAGCLWFANEKKDKGIITKHSKQNQAKNIYTEGWRSSKTELFGKFSTY